MTFLEIFLTILIALLVGTLFYFVFKTTGPWGTFWTFALILILVGLAAAIWIEPVGPLIYDFAWLPILFVILIFALILAAATPPRKRSRDLDLDTPTTGKESSGADVAAVAALGIFFWFLLIFLFVAVLVGIFA
jgi:hypothetical protein